MEFINHFIPSNNVVSDVSQTGGENMISLELGDIIKIISPSNDGLHDKTFLITYCGSQTLAIQNTSTGNLHELNISEDGYGFSDESIIGIELLKKLIQKNGAKSDLTRIIAIGSLIETTDFLNMSPNKKKTLKENMIWCNKKYEEYLDSQE